MAHGLLVENFAWLAQSWWHNYICAMKTLNRSGPGKRYFSFHFHLKTLSTSAKTESISIFPIIKAIECGNLS